MEKTYGVINLSTKTGKQYSNFQTVPFSTDPKKQAKATVDAQVQAEYEAHCLL